MDDKKLAVIKIVLKECFWNDYKLNPETVYNKLASGDPVFENFLVSRIIRDSRFPSARLLALFSHDKLVTLLDSARVGQRAERRRTLVKAVIFNKKWEEEPSWVRI